MSSAAPAPQPLPEANYSVFDPSASADYDGSTPAKRRRHILVIEGVEIAYGFTNGQPTKMSFAEAMRFAKAGFIVKDPNGRSVFSAHDALDGVVAAPRIAVDEVVANLAELTIPALVKRAVVIEGGSRFGGNSSRDELVSFLTRMRSAAVPKRAETVAGAIPTEIEEVVDALGKGEFDRAFGDKPGPDEA